MFRTVYAIFILMLVTPVFADGDAKAGKKAFNKCKSCHMIVDNAGEVIVKGGKTGPNLWNIVNRTMGTQEGFKYSKLMVVAAEQELRLDVSVFGDYLSDPSGWLKEQTGDKGKSKMLKQRVKDADVLNLWAFLSESASPES
ncbi:MAG: c-type cytochrome [Aestuariivita sp.]|nr:c-type cytochrome [Aestuariivita sp.]